MMEPNFSLDDFKRWMRSQDEPKSLDRKVHRNVIGMLVESKVGMKKLCLAIEPDSGNLDELARDFRKEGGTVIDVDGKLFLIEVNSGTFFVPRHYIRPA